MFARLFCRRSCLVPCVSFLHLAACLFVFQQTCFRSSLPLPILVVDGNLHARACALSASRARMLYCPLLSSSHLVARTWCGNAVLEGYGTYCFLTAEHNLFCAYMVASRSQKNGWAILLYGSVWITFVHDSHAPPVGGWCASHVMRPENGGAAPRVLLYRAMLTSACHRFCLTLLSGIAS